MSLTTTIKNAVNVAFDALGDLVSTVTYVSAEHTGTGGGTYNPVTGEIDSDSDTEVTEVEAIIIGYTAREVDGSSIQMGDQRAIIKSSDLSSVTPNEKDEIKIGTDTWHVVSFLKDPANATYEFQIRR